MKQQEIRNNLLKIIDENGITVLENGDLTNMDSLQFVSSLVSIEEYFKIEFPDEFLSLENQYNLDTISGVVYELLQENNSN